MKKLEVFFDYFCPYCLKGHDQLVEFVKDKPDLELIWHPCEIYKLPGNPYATKRTNNCIQGMFFAAEKISDLWKYHQRVYDLIFVEKVSVDDVDAFTGYFKGIFGDNGVREFGDALKGGKYKGVVDKANGYAFQETGVHVVPTYRADGGVLQDRQEFFDMGYSDTAYGGKK